MTRVNGVDEDPFLRHILPDAPDYLLDAVGELPGSGHKITAASTLHAAGCYIPQRINDSRADEKPQTTTEAIPSASQPMSIWDTGIAITKSTDPTVVTEAESLHRIITDNSIE